MGILMGVLSVVSVIATGRVTYQDMMQTGSV